MKRLTVRAFIGFFVICFLSVNLHSQSTNEPDNALTARHKSIITVAAYTALGDLEDLKTALNSGLDAGLTINEIKEVIVHLYAYCGFPRSIRGLQTFMEVLGQRKERGINDKTGPDASPIHTEQSKYERGKKVLEELTKATEPIKTEPVIQQKKPQQIEQQSVKRSVLEELTGGMSRRNGSDEEPAQERETTDA